MSHELKGNRTMTSRTRTSPVRTAVAGLLAGAALVALMDPSFADIPVKPAQHFSFAGKRPSFRQEGTTKSDVAVSALDSEGRMTLQDEIWHSDFSVPPHFHKTHAETFYVVSGRVEWTVGGETHVLGTGDSVHIPPNTVHSVKVLDGKDAHMLMVYLPGGYEEHMAREEAYTVEQLKDPKIRDELRKLNDFNVPSNK